MPTLSKLSKAFLLPIALLPIAGVFLGVGAAIANAADAQTGLWYFGTVMNKMGDVAFGNLPVLFCISVALAYTKDAGVAALTAVVGFLVMNALQGALLHPTMVNATEELVKQYKDLFNGFYEGKEVVLGMKVANLDAAGKVMYSLLWHNNIPNGLITSNLGVNSLNTGVFAGIFVGAISAKCYNTFHKTQLPSALSFFSGTKLVPIITFFAVIPLGFIFVFFWPWIGQGLAWFGTKSGDIPVKGIDSLVFEMIERSLVPFGLHHVFYSPLWWTSAGGSIADIVTRANTEWIVNNNPTALINGLDMFNWQEQASAFAGHNITWPEFFTTVTGNKDLFEAMGDQTMMARLIANIDNSKGINFTSFQLLGLNLGRFQSGKFGFMLLGLPMAALAMWFNVPKENRKNVMGIYFSAAFTCFLTGITEPIEYTFLFLAPWLFYGVHMPLAAISFMFAGMLQTHVSMTVSGGFIDYIVFGIIPFFNGAMSATSVFGVLGVAAVMGPVYFCAFYFAVKYGNVMVPGRDTSGPTELFTKDDYKASKGQNRDGSKIVAVEASTGASKWTASSNPTEIARYEKAAKIIEFLGGEANITDVDSCASRLRLTVIDSSVVNKDGIMSLGGSTGALVRGTNVQVVYGGEQEAIKPRIKEILEIQRSQSESQSEVEKKITVGVKTEATKVEVAKPEIVEAKVKTDAKKITVSKPVAKKVEAKKTTVSKPTTKKVEAKSTAASKPVAKKPVAKKVETKKTTK
ncbi:PTS sugar transporter [Mesoplasma syrphidae]|uniref:PTS sugar transporter n=2 Tax=Mesoplasma syrphidae TaxID=225999 RepID=A0A2K9BW36_9MOLU|nr:PTS sugar transporter [Mesoplasma syrphidae]